VVGDILLLRPCGRKTDGRIFAMEQLGLSYIAGNARAAGLTVDIVDGALQPERYLSVLRTIKTGDFALIGYPIYPETIRHVARDVSMLRMRNVETHVTVGNHLATLHDTAVLSDFPQFDSAIRGEGEQTTIELARCVRSNSSLSSVEGLTYRQGAKIIRNRARPNIVDLDRVAFPARDTLPHVLAAGNAPLIYSSRGCNARCEFCSVHNYFNASANGSWRARSPRNVVDEIEQIYQRYGVTDFAFADEQFLGHGRPGRERALAIADEIMRRRLDINWYVETRASGIKQEVFSRLREAGLRAVFMGLESGHDQALRAMHKGLRVEQSLQAIEVLTQLEILPSVGFIMFGPDTTIEELRDNLKFLAAVGCVEISALVTRMRIYSGTGIERRLVSQNRLHGTYFNYDWSFQDPRVGECYGVALESADTLTVSYNSFASFRRKGIVTYSECLKLQRAMNARPIEIMSNLVDAIVRDGGVSDVTRSATRQAFVDACQEFLRMLRFVEACASKREVSGNVRLLSPMYLC
jgi:anaerobic magnesium-protoporphyrin IX monomethyl ester cyclase